MSRKAMRKKRAGSLLAPLLGATLVSFVVVALYHAGGAAGEGQWLGMEVEPLTPEMRVGLRLHDRQPGVLVSDVVGIAAERGVREGDVVVRIGGQATTDITTFQIAAQAADAAGGARVAINRQGVPISIVLRSQPAMAAPQAPPGVVQAALPPACATNPSLPGCVPAALPPVCANTPTAPGCFVTPAAAPLANQALPVVVPPPGQSSNMAWLGAKVADVLPAEAAALGLPPGSNGVIVDQVTAQSRAAQAGVQPNDVIVRVNGQPALGSRQFWALLALHQQGAPVQLEVVRNQQQLAVTLLSASPLSGATQAALPCVGAQP